MRVVESVTRTSYPLSPKKIIKKTITSVAYYFFILGAFLFIFLMYSIFIWAQDIIMPHRDLYLSCIAIVLCILVPIIIISTYIYQRYYYATYFYNLDPDHVTIRKNPIVPSEITIPYDRIQDIYVNQDGLDRLFGLYDVHFSSATQMSGGMAHIDGLIKSAADGLRGDLLTRVLASRKK